MPDAVTRMPAGERRDQLLDAATKAFARGGYHGTSTESIAREAGVSQPFVFRVFGTKLELFLQVFARAADRIRLGLEAVIDERPFDRDSSEDAARLLSAYNILADHDLVQIVMHGCAAGDVDAIAAQSRTHMADIFETLRRTGWGPERCREFLGQGMLMAVLLSMRAVEHLGESAQLDGLTGAGSSGSSASVGPGCWFRG